MVTILHVDPHLNKTCTSEVDHKSCLDTGYKYRSKTIYDPVHLEPTHGSIADLGDC